MRCPCRSSIARWWGSAWGVVVFALATGASAKLVKYGLGTVDLIAIGPGGVVVDASTHDLRVSDDGNDVVLTVGLASLASRVDIADERLKAALEVDKCPTAVLTVPRRGLRFPTSNVPTRGSVRGSLRLHCQTREVTFDYEAKRDGEFLDARGVMRLDMRDFGVPLRRTSACTLSPT